MKCLWTQKVSLLVDGELEPAEAREVEQHLDTCADCREARADFLSLRRQLTAYQIDFDAFAGQRALKSILAAGAGGAKTKRDGVNPRRRDEWFAGVFGMPRLSPVGLAALLLLLFGVAVGVVSLINTRRPHADVAKTAPAPVKDLQRNSNGNAATASPSTPIDTPAGTSAGTSDGGHTIAGNDLQPAGEDLTTANRPTAFEQTRARAPRSERLPRRERARLQAAKSPSSPRLDQRQVDPPVAETANNVEAFDNSVGAFESSEAGEELSSRRGRDVTNDSKTARHVEQAQLLLRSFRNARLADEGRRASTDIAYDRRQSKKLLYQNIVLRREAASRGNLPVESLLDSLEPILIDIANLPDKPAPADVREINERMRRKNLVAMLQISSVESASARSY